MDSHHTSRKAADDTSPIGHPGEHFRHKAVAGLLAFALGWAGAHYWYLGRRYAWAPLLFSLVTLGTALRHEAWYFHPAFFLFLIPAVAGFVEALVICLTPDAKFDAKYNAGLARQSQTGWGPILVAMVTLAVGTAILMIGIVLMFQSVYDVAPDTAANAPAPHPAARIARAG